MTDGLPLFAYTPPPRHDPDQERELKRVSGRLAETILEFLRERVGQRFHAEDLRAHIHARTESAPGSADRILRMLRRSGQCDYEILNRSQSLYLCRAVAP